MCNNPFGGRAKYTRYTVGNYQSVGCLGDKIPPVISAAGYRGNIEQSLAANTGVTDHTAGSLTTDNKTRGTTAAAVFSRKSRLVLCTKIAADFEQRRVFFL